MFFEEKVRRLEPRGLGKLLSVCLAALAVQRRAVAPDAHVHVACAIAYGAVAGVFASALVFNITKMRE